MFPSSQTNWSRSAKLWSKACNSLQQRKLLYRERWPTHSQGTERLSLIHPRLERGKIGHVRQRSQNGDKHRVMAQANQPHKPPTTPRDAIEGSHNRTSDLRFEMSRPSMQSMPTRKTTSTSIPKGELHKQGSPRRNTLGCMGTGSNAVARRMPLLRHLHR